MSPCRLLGLKRDPEEAEYVRKWRHFPFIHLAPLPTS